MADPTPDHTDQPDVQGDVQENPSSQLIEITVKNAATGDETPIKVVKTDTVFDVKQYIADAPSTSLESCFNLLANGVVVDPFTAIGDIPNIEDHPVLDLVYAAYTDGEAKKHLSKVRELLGFANDAAVDGTRSFPVVGAGASNFYSIKDLNIPQADQVAFLEANCISPEQLKAPLPATELIAAPAPAAQPAVRALNLSHWNPPPAHLQLKGHLFYLQVTTLEGSTYHITARTTGFHVNNTAGEKFDASPRTVNGKVLQDRSLLALIQQLSPAVEGAIVSNATALNAVDPHAYIKPTNTFFASPWITNLPTSFTPDLSRTQDLSNESLPVSKDWNEELQSSRELPKEHIQERIVRERLLSKLSFEFAEAATKGAMAIVKGNVTALNSEEPETAHIFLHNGVFYSYGVDSTGVYTEQGADAAARYAVGKEAAGATFLNKLDVAGLCPLATTVVDFGGRRILAQTPVPGIFRENPENESQIVYGSIENKQSIVADETFAPLMQAVSDAVHVKAHTVFDNSGNATELVSASSINGLVGTDNRKYVLDMHKLTPLDLGFYDDVKASGDEYPHFVGTLRPEAVEEWWRIHARERVTAKLNEKKAAKASEPKSEPEPKAEAEAEGETKEGEETETKEEEKVELTTEENQVIIDAALKEFRVNPDVPLDLETIPAGEVREAYTKDAETIREISTLIKENWIPNFISELKAGNCAVPFDGTQLTHILHKRGINMRYLGYLAELAAKEGEKLEVFRNLIVQEIVARSVKHHLAAILAQYPAEFASEIVPHYLNCLLGYKINSKPSINIDASVAAIYPSVDLVGLAQITVDSVRAAVAEQAKRRFRHELAGEWLETLAPLPLFREISIKNGFQWRGRNYNFETVEPVKTTVKKSKKGKKEVATTSSPVLFTSDDLLNIVPIVKFSSFHSHMAEEALEAGRLNILRGETEVGLELLGESLTLHEHVYGPIHPETARTYSQLALVYHELKESAKACEYGRKAVIIQERCNGVDSAETILVYLNLALFEHNNDNTAGAIALIKHAFKYWASICSPDHPDSVTTMNNVATMLQNVKLHTQAVEWYKASLNLTVKVYGASSPNVAALYYQISQSQVVLQDYNAAVESMRESHRIFNENFGAEDNNTKETKLWLDQLVQVAVNVAKANKAAGVNGASGAAEGSPEAAVAAAAAAASANRRARLHTRGPASAASSGAAASTVAQPKAKVKAALDSKNIDELVDYINGTGPSLKNKSKKKGKKN